MNRETSLSHPSKMYERPHLAISESPSKAIHLFRSWSQHDIFFNEKKSLAALLAGGDTVAVLTGSKEELRSDEEFVPNGVIVVGGDTEALFASHMETVRSIIGVR